MYDFMEYCLLRYYRKIQWSQDNYYSGLSSTSRPLLDFRVPTGLSCTLGTSISPHLKSVYTLGLPNTRSVGFLFTSVPLNLPTMHLRDEHDTQEVRVYEKLKPGYPLSEDLNSSSISDSTASSQEAGSNAVQDHTKEIAFIRKSKPYLLYGRLFQDGHLEGLYSKLVGKNWLLVASGISSWYPHASHLTTQLIHNTDRWCSEITYTTDSNVFGISSIYSIPRENETTFSLGTEVYYTANERSGGLSFGGRYLTRHQTTPQEKSTESAEAPTTNENAVPTTKQPKPFTDMALTLNPMMGHLTTAYTTTINPQFTMSTRYDMNMYSFESDIAVGGEFRSFGMGTSADLDKPLMEKKNEGQVLKARLSMRNGVGVKLEGKYKRALWSVGMETEFGRYPRRRVGIELQLS